MTYIPPSGDAANFELLAYTPPAGDAANFDFTDSIPSERSSEISGIGTANSERSSEITGINVIPIHLEYRIIVLDENGDPIGEFESFNNLKFGKRLNNYGSAQFDILVNDPKTSSLIALRRYTIEIYRRQGSNTTRVWAGEQAMRSGSLDNKGLGWVTIYCFTWLEMLNHRFTLAPQSYEAVDAGDIAWDLIDRTQQQWVRDSQMEYTGTAANNATIGTIDWEDVAQAEGPPDGNSSTTELANGQISKYLKLTNFGLAVPSNATILGIKASVLIYREDQYAIEHLVKIVKGGTITGDSKGTGRDLPVAPDDDYIEYGGEQDLWGQSWTPSDINGSTFGLVFSVKANGGDDIVGVDAVKMTVYYEYPTEDPNGDFGITEGTIEATIDRDRTYYNENIMQAIINLSNVISGFDFDITDDKVFNVYSLMGTDKTDSVVLEYGKNIVSARIDEDFVHPANRAIVLGEVLGDDSLQRVVRDDTDSQDDFKIREQVESETDISEIETLEDRGDAVLRKYSLPLLKVEMALVKGSDPSILDFNLGDLIRLIIVYGLYSIDEDYRVFEWEIAYGSDNAETLTLVLGRFTFAHPMFS